MEERIFYKPAMKAGISSFQVYIPFEVKRALEIEDRDELEIRVRKTGKKIPKTTRFIKKEEVETNTASTGLEEREDTSSQRVEG